MGARIERSQPSGKSCAFALVPLLLGACARIETVSDDPYHSFCTSIQVGPDIAEYLAARGIDCMDGGADLGLSYYAVRGSRETQFRARRLVQEKARTDGWRVGWPADSIVLADQWDEIGFERGPWVRLAGIRHRDLPTENVLNRLDRAGIPALFMFGETLDLILVKSSDGPKAAAILREESDPAVVAYDREMCAHQPPRSILRGKATRVSLLLSTSLSGKPLRERVEDVMCSVRTPGHSVLYGWSMKIQETTATSILATFDLPVIPLEADGFVEYDFSFELDGRRYSHPLSTKFRVPLE
jgi:hypothetical protein